MNLIALPNVFSDAFSFWCLLPYSLILLYLDVCTMSNDCSPLTSPAAEVSVLRHGCTLYVSVSMVRYSLTAEYLCEISNCVGLLRRASDEADEVLERDRRPRLAVDTQ